MSNKENERTPLRHRLVEVDGISIHAVEGGEAESVCVLFLHGWPENWTAFQHVMGPLSEEAHVVAIDLPGIGGSETPPISNDKRTLAKYVRGVIEKMKLNNVTLVGHDVGGQIVFAYLHEYPNELKSAVIMNVAIPGVDPWSEVERNPHIWHFGFHSVPELPEKLVTGNERIYFDFFYNILSTSGGVSEEARETFVNAYTRPTALSTGFDWYRAFSQDEKDNLSVKGGEAVGTPVLYLRGKDESGNMESYLKGFRESGLRNVRGEVIAKSGHFLPIEQPEGVLSVLREHLGLAARSK